jgi:hypothetical protein
MRITLPRKAWAGQLATLAAYHRRAAIYYNRVAADGL